MADYDDADPAAEDEFENDDEEMEDANEAEQDGDAEQDADDDAGDDDEDEDDEDEDEDADADQPDSPSTRHRQQPPPRRSPTRADSQPNPALVLTSPSPRPAHVRSPNPAIVTTYTPPTRPEALTAQAYDIIPTIAAPQSTSINAIAATPDMRWVFSGGTDGYVRMYNWVETANGKVPLTVAQKHPFVDSVMKAGSLLTYWENEESHASLRTPTRGEDEGKWSSPVYSLAVQHQATWLLSGLESGGINLQTCRHQAGTRITTLKEHTSAVSVLALSQDESSLLSGSWDKRILDWDLQTGKVKRVFDGSRGQISAVEIRPTSDVPIPEISETLPDNLNGTFSSNNANGPRANSAFPNGAHEDLFKGEEEDAMGSPDGSLFGETSLFGEDNVGGGGAGNAFGEDDDDPFTSALANGPQDEEEIDAPGEEEDADMSGMGSGGPVQAPSSTLPQPTSTLGNGQPAHQTNGASQPRLTNGALPHTTFSSDNEPLTAPPTENSTTTTDLPPQSESTFLSAALDGSLRIWDRRVQLPIATIMPSTGTPPWCTGACWSPDGLKFFAGRKNNAVDEFEIRFLGGRGESGGNGGNGGRGNEPSRTFKFQPGSGPVYAVRAMPNKRHLVCASHDILRIYDLQHNNIGLGGAEAARGGRQSSRVPFTIVPGHRGGVIASLWVDPGCRFMLSAAGNRGWEGQGTEVLLGYEIGVLDEGGV
ncbi:hypothetical protein LTR08_005042 [Meristemomyces frigidus]|nr:hypothetical protein LTR08_005042 [Meristemomyces frigidus]